MRRALVALAALATFLVGCQGPEGGIVVSEARVGAPAGPNAALYFTVTNDGDADRLVGASTEVAESAEIHETTLDEDGTMGMAAVAGIDVGTDETVVLEPGGLHVMLLGVDRLEEGETVSVTLRWERAGELDVSADVVSPAETVGHEH